MTTPIGMIFPGQGSQHPGMLAEFATRFSEVRACFDTASDSLGYDLWAICQDNPEDKLNQTEITQPALLTAGVALWRVWQRECAKPPVVMAGHSLGEYTALVCAGALAFTDAVKLVALRGRLMQQAVPVGVGAMAAIIGLTDAEVVALCERYIGEGQVSPANYNCPGQVVVAGDTAAVDWLVASAKPAGAKMAKILPVSVPSHSALMSPVSDTFAKAIQQTPMVMPLIPVVHNVDASGKTDISAIKMALVHQISQPVLWTDCMQAMIARGVQCFVECGPGKVLTGLCKRIHRDSRAIALSSISDTLSDSLGEALGDKLC